MKKNSKLFRGLSLIAILSLTVTAFCACKSSDSNAGKTASGTEAQASDTTDTKNSTSDADKANKADAGKADHADAATAGSSDAASAGNTGAASADSSDAASAGSSDTASAGSSAAGKALAANPAIDTITVKTEDASGYTKDGGIYTITKGGEYKFKGELSEGQIIVNAKDEEVVIALNGVDITSTFDSVIYVEDAKEVTIKALDGTSNILRDKRPRRVDENEDLGSACIYSKDDLKLQGKGRLEVEATYNNGIHSKNDIKIKNLTLTVTCPNNCIKGNDSITIESGFITVTSFENDGLKTKNTDVSKKGKQHGIITISGGTVTINAPSKCINAAFDKQISEEATVIKNKTEK